MTFVPNVSSVRIRMTIRIGLSSAKTRNYRSDKQSSRYNSRNKLFSHIAPSYSIDDQTGHHRSLGKVRNRVTDLFRLSVSYAGSITSERQSPAGFGTALKSELPGTI